MASSTKKLAPRTPEQRALTRKLVEERVAKATPAEKARVEALRDAAKKLK